MTKENEEWPEGKLFLPRIREISIELNRFEFGGGTFKYTFLKHFSTWPLIEMNSPSSIVARFPLQGRSEGSKAPSGISPSGLKVLGKFNPAQGIELGYFQAITCYISGLWDHIWKCIISQRNIVTKYPKSKEQNITSIWRWSQAAVDQHRVWSHWSALRSKEMREWKPENVFVLIDKCICPNSKMYLSEDMENKHLFLLKNS